MTEILSQIGLAGADPGATAALACSFLWALTSILFTSAGRNVAPAATNLFKTVAAMLLFGVALTFRDGVPFDATLDARRVVLLALSGFVGFALGDTSLFAAYQILGTRRAMLIQSSHPVVGLLLAIVFFREWPSALQFVGIMIVLVGISLVLGDARPRPGVSPAQRRKGVGLAFLAGAGQAAGVMLAKEALIGADAFGATQVRVAGGAVALTLWALARGHLRGWVRGLTRPDVLWRVGVASVMGPFLAVWMMLYAIQNAPAGVALALLATAPVWLLPLGSIFQKDVPSRKELAGVLVAMAGIVLLLR